MVLLDLAAPAGEIREGMAVGREREGDALEGRDPVEAGEELGQRIGAGDQARDVRGDRRQHVVAGEEDTIGGRVEAEVVVGVTRRVHGHPLAPAERDDVLVDDPPARLWRPHPSATEQAHGLERHPALHRRLERSPAPRLLDRPRSVPGAGGTVRCVGVVGQFVGTGVVTLVGVEPGAERGMGQHVCSGLVAQDPGAAEVVRVAVGHDDGVHVLHRIAGPPQAVDQRVPRRLARQARIDHGDPAVVTQGVGVDVPEAGQRDGQLHPEDVGGDLDHVLGGRLLFLSGRPVLRRHVRRPYLTDRSSDAP